MVDYLAIDADDLKQMGYPPGPRFKQILDAVEEAQLEGRFSTRDEALEFVRANHPSVSV